jgi:nitroreductase
MKPIEIIAVGYPGEKPARLKRMPRERLVHYERW